MYKEHVRPRASQAGSILHAVTQIMRLNPICPAMVKPISGYFVTEILVKFEDTLAYRLSVSCS
jgi:hypothetical protein